MTTATTTTTTPLDAAYAAIDLHTTDPLHRAKSRALMVGYDRLYRQHDYRVLGVEETITAPLINIDTNRSSRTFELAGKLDVRLLDADGRTVLMDHKTSSDDITDPDAMYWRQLIVESQPSHYMLLEWLNGRKVDYCVWDVVRKPAIRPSQIDKADRDKLSRTGLYCGYHLTNRDWAEYDILAAESGKPRETPTMYEARLAEDCSVTRPEWYFKRRRVNRLDGELEEYARELWQHAEEMRIATAAERHPRASGSCIRYHQPCRFLGICSGYDNHESDRWRRKPWVHAELPIMDGNGKQYLTNSRIRDFQSCRRSHQYNYLIGIERDEDRDALIFGTLWHEAQAAWWSTFMRADDMPGEACTPLDADHISAPGSTLATV